MTNSITKAQTRWLRFWDDDQNFETPFTIVFSLQIVCVLVVYFILRVALLRFTFLPEAAYFQPCLYLGFLKQWVTKPYLLIPLLVGMLAFNKRLLLSWHGFESGTRLRNIVCFMAAMLAVRHSFYPYNFYLDQAHLADRLLLLSMVGLVFWRPFFVMPFLSIVLVIIGQFELLAGYSLADSLMPIHILIMFVAFYLFRIVSQKFSFINFLFMMGCVIASNYFFSGLGKANYEWIFLDRISNIMPNSYALGWNGGWDIETLKSMTGLMTWANVPLKILTLGVELGILFFFFRVTWTRALLLAAIVFHVGIFFSSGICFWFWSVMHIFLLVYVWRKRACDTDRLFNLQRMAFAVLVIASAGFWNNPVKLVWLSKPFTYVSYVEAKTAAGESYRLSPDFFGAYDYNFTYQNFHDMHSADGVKRLGFGGPKSPKEVFHFFLTDRTDKEILDFEKVAGKEHPNVKRRARLERFLKQYMQNYNQTKHSRQWIGALKAPDLLWQETGVSKLPPTSNVVEITLHCSTNYFSAATGPRVIRQEEIVTILIDE